MKIGEKLLKKLSKKYLPDEMIHERFERYDISFKTDEDGNPILLFIGSRKENGMIAGEYFFRVLIREKNGIVIKDHWDCKGKVS